MLRRSLRCFLQQILKDGTILDGTFHPTATQRLVSGIAKLPDGRCFKGTFDAERGFPLPGSQLEEDGDLYVGSYNAEWQRHGEGEAWLADGTHYKGQFDSDELVDGTVRIPHGMTEVIFQGTLVDEEFSKGTLKQHDFTYTGQFQQNRPHGKGKLVFANGATQEGTFVDGQLHGESCTMKLEGGFVYVGSFVNGKVVRGLLYTPTYTYDGEFSEQGKAHGEGSQEHLTVSPKLTFTGVWHHGTMVRGTCVNEHGEPVDWRDRHDLQEKVLKDEHAEDGHMELNRLCETKLREADAMHKEYRASYTHDAKKVQAATGGAIPSKDDLGYDHHGVRASHEAMAKHAAQESREDPASAVASMRSRLPPNVEEASSGLHAAVDPNMAKMHMLDQAGTQHLMGQRMEEQMHRFEASLGADQSKRGLRIDGNPTWKGFTAKSS